MQVKYHYYSLAICFCIIFCVFIFWRLFHPIYEVKKEFKSKKISQEQVFTFKFYEKYFTICHNMDYSKMKYYKLYKIYETKTFFYLYIDNDHAFLINKSGFVRGLSDDFSKFINKKCLFKYKSST
ncbi:MAG: YcxB family protein [Clostridia bacterium]